MNDWWESSANVSALLNWMRFRDHDSTPEDVRDAAYMIDKPWKYQPEWDEMQAEIAQSFAQKDGAP